MQFNKYSKDFTVEYEKTPDGRRKARAVYKGGYYDFVDTASGVRRTAAYFTALCAAAWCAVLVPAAVSVRGGPAPLCARPHVCTLFRWRG